MTDFNKCELWPEGKQYISFFLYLWPGAHSLVSCILPLIMSVSKQRNVGFGSDVGFRHYFFKVTCRLLNSSIKWPKLRVLSEFLLYLYMSIYEEEEKGVFMRVQLWREEPTGPQCRTLHNPVLITLTGSDKKHSGEHCYGWEQRINLFQRIDQPKV